MPVVSIANQKGGCGKTITAINLSAGLATHSCSVLLIDFDPQAHTSLAMGFDPDSLNKTIYEVLVNPRLDINSAISSSHFKNLDILPANILLSGAEMALIAKNRREFILKGKIAQLKKRYDFIIIDCPPSLGLLTVNALTASSGLVIPVQTHYFSLEGLKQILNTVEIVKRSLNPNLRIYGILPTIFEATAKMDNDVIRGLRDYFKNSVFKTAINKDVRLVEACSAGEPIMQYKHDSSGAHDYAELAQELLSIIK